MVEGEGCDGEKACHAFSVTTSIFCPFTPDAHTWLRLSHIILFHLHFSSLPKIGQSRDPGGTCPKSWFPLQGEAGREELETTLLRVREAGTHAGSLAMLPPRASRPEELGQRLPSFLPPGGPRSHIWATSPSSANRSPIDFSFFPPSLCLGNDVHQG